MDYALKLMQFTLEGHLMVIYFKHISKQGSCLHSQAMTSHWEKQKRI